MNGAHGSSRVLQPRWRIAARAAARSSPPTAAAIPIATEPELLTIPDLRRATSILNIHRSTTQTELPTSAAKPSTLPEQQLPTKPCASAISAAKRRLPVPVRKARAEATVTEYIPTTSCTVTIPVATTAKSSRIPFSQWPGTSHATAVRQTTPVRPATLERQLRRRLALSEPQPQPKPRSQTTPSPPPPPSPRRQR